MTFQIGIVGSDGVLLASDCQYVSGISAEGAYRHSSMSSKLYWDRGEIGCCPSGNCYSDIAAQYCIQESSRELSTKELLRAACHLALERAKTHGQVIDELQGSVLLVRRDGGRSVLWEADIQHVAPTDKIIVPKDPRLVLNRVWAGDRSNPAVFFIERYLPKRATISINDLAFMAAYVITAASKLNDSGIRGVQILLCPHGAEAFKLVSGEHIDDLVSRSNQLDDDIATRLGINSSTLR